LGIEAGRRKQAYAVAPLAYHPHIGKGMRRRNSEEKTEGKEEEAKGRRARGLRKEKTRGRGRTKRRSRREKMW